MKIQHKCIEYFERGIEQSERCNHEAAIDLFTQAIKCKPSWALPYFWRAGEYEELKQYNLAIADFTIYIDQAGSDSEDLLAEAYAGRAYNLKLQGEYQRAIDDYTTELELNPNSAICYLDRSLVFDAIGNFKAANADYQKAVQLDPTIVDLVKGEGPIDWKCKTRGKKRDI